MLPMDGKHRWMFVVEIVILFHGIFLKSSICESSEVYGKCQLKNVLVVSAKVTDKSYVFPTKAVYRSANGSKLCFRLHGTISDADCCQGFNCSFNVNVGQANGYSLIMKTETLSRQDIVVMTEPEQNYKCMPSKLYSKTSGFIFNTDACLNHGVKNIRLSQNDFCGQSSPYDEDTCIGLAERDHESLNGKKHCVSCKLPANNSITTPPSMSTTTTTVDNAVNGTTTTVDNAVNGTTTTVDNAVNGTTTTALENAVNGTTTTFKDAVNIMNNLSSMLGDLNIKKIISDNIKGVIIKLPHKNQTEINVGMTQDDVSILLNVNDLRMDCSRLVRIPKEASDMAVKRNGSFAGVLLFRGMHPVDPSSSFVANEVMGIKMGAEISNLSDTVDIHFRNVDKNGKNASCTSWDGKGKEQNWITDGCQTRETSEGITCQCSHLTFFAILLSPPSGNISASDFRSLTYITSVGCGLSMFFLAVGLFMYFLIRKGKASQATKILMNLFVAMFNLNLSFLVNESIANLEIFGACVAIATVMHYAMLATFTWFFMEALHLYFNLRNPLSRTKHYMTKIYVAGWVTPAAVVIGLLASGKYDYLVIYTNDGNSAKMCWISDAAIHQGVNIGYYAIVFIFTFIIFILTVRQIVILKPAAQKAQNISSIKTNSFSILGLFLLLGITWAFAFFSFGPLLLASYYIFTILNSFQGFFLFIYYYNSSKVVREGGSSSSSSKATSNTAAISPYQ